MGRWSRFRRLSPQERRLLAAALVLLPLTRLGLYLVGFRRWQSLLIRLLPRHVPSPRVHGDAQPPPETCGEVTARMVQAAAREGLGAANCLERSLVLWWLLARQGGAAELRIGTRKKDAELEAHAWVELAGRVLGEEGDPHKEYAAFEESIAAGPHGLNVQRP